MHNVQFEVRAARPLHQQHAILARPGDPYRPRRCVNLVVEGWAFVRAASHRENHPPAGQTHQGGGQQVHRRVFVEVQHRRIRQQHLEAAGVGAEPITLQQRHIDDGSFSLAASDEGGGAVDHREVRRRHRLRSDILRGSPTCKRDTASGYEGNTDKPAFHGRHP